MLAQIQKIPVDFCFAFRISGKQSIIAVPNNTLLEFFTEKAYVSDIWKDPKFIIIENSPKKIAEKIYIAQIRDSDFCDESHIEKPKIKQVKDRNILEYALKQKIPVRQNTMAEYTNNNVIGIRDVFKMNMWVLLRFKRIPLSISMVVIPIITL